MNRLQIGQNQLNVNRKDGNKSRTGEANRDKMPSISDNGQYFSLFYTVLWPRGFRGLVFSNF
jgi:hypothetical protein